MKKMENVKIENIKMKFCGLCFQALNDVNFKAMETLTRDMLDILLLKQNLDEGSKYFLCNDCYEKACAALKFKSICLDTEDAIFPYVNCEGVIDLREVYFKAKENEQLIDVFNDQQICRLCMRLFRGEYISFDEVEKYMLLIYIPELNFSATKDPVICKPCFECLGIHSGFINSCLHMAEKRKHVCDDGGVKLPVETEDIQLKLEQSEQERNEFLIKAEEVQIKSEEVEIKSEQVEVQSEEVEIKSEVEQDSPQFPSSHDVHLNESCHDKKKINYESMLLVDNDSDMGWYKCGLCQYKSKKKGYLMTRHMLIHMNPSEIQWYKCDLCGYKSKRKSDLKRHMLTHEDATETKDPSQRKWYKCDVCIYMSKEKRSLETHMITHKDPSEIKWYKCDLCSYKSKWRNALKRHMLTHKDAKETKDPSQRKWYKCDVCIYMSKEKGSWETHMLTHKDPSEIKWYKCALCNYVSNIKSRLNRHTLKHKDPTKEQWYECDLCNYKTKYKIILKTHTVTHKNRT